MECHCPVLIFFFFSFIFLFLVVFLGSSCLLDIRGWCRVGIYRSFPLLSRLRTYFLYELSSFLPLDEGSSYIVIFGACTASIEKFIEYTPLYLRHSHSLSPQRALPALYCYTLLLVIHSTSPVGIALVFPFFDLTSWSFSICRWNRLRWVLQEETCWIMSLGNGISIQYS